MGTDRLVVTDTHQIITIELLHFSDGCSLFSVLSRSSVDLSKHELMLPISSFKSSSTLHDVHLINDGPFRVK